MSKRARISAGRADAEQERAALPTAAPGKAAKPLLTELGAAFVDFFDRDHGGAFWKEVRLHQQAGQD